MTQKMTHKQKEACNQDVNRLMEKMQEIMTRMRGKKITPKEQKLYRFATNAWDQLYEIGVTSE